MILRFKKDFPAKMAEKRMAEDEQGGSPAVKAGCTCRGTAGQKKVDVVVRFLKKQY